MPGLWTQVDLGPAKKELNVLIFCLLTGHFLWPAAALEFSKSFSVSNPTL